MTVPRTRVVEWEWRQVDIIRIYFRGRSGRTNKLMNRGMSKWEESNTTKQVTVALYPYLRWETLEKQG